MPGDASGRRETERICDRSRDRTTQILIRGGIWPWFFVSSFPVRSRLSQLSRNNVFQLSSHARNDNRVDGEITPDYPPTL